MRTISLTVSPDTATGILTPFDGNVAYPSTRSGNRLQWELAETGGARLHVEAPGYQAVDTFAVLPEGSNELPWGPQGQETAKPLDLEPLAALLTQPQAVGHVFTMGGAPWSWQMMTGFCDYALLLRGEQGQLEDVLGEARDLGSTGRRVFLQMHYITDFAPAQFGADFYTRLPEFVALENRYGQIPELVLYCDEQVINSGPNHFTNCSTVLGGLANATELANEWSKNGIDPTQFPRFVNGLLWSRGSDVSEAAIVQPPGNYATFHERRDLFKAIGRGYKAAEACWDFGFDVPFVFNEPLGAAEDNQPGRRSNDPHIFAALAAQYRAVGAGMTFHSEAGLTSAPLGPRQLECAKAFYEVLT